MGSKQLVTQLLEEIEESTDESDYTGALLKVKELQDALEQLEEEGDN